MTAYERIRAVLASLDPKPLLSGEGVVDSEEVLWVEGLYPLMTTTELHAFIAYAKASGSAVWTAGLPGWGLYYGPAKAALSASSFQALLDKQQRYQTNVSLRPLRDAFDYTAMVRELFHREANRVLADGVLVLSPDSTMIDSGVQIAPGVVIGPNVRLAGRTSIGAGSHIDMGSCLTDTSLAEGVHVKPYTVIEASYVGPGAVVGPFAHLRPGTELGPDTRIGNFVEVKKSKIGRGSKANHLAYLGDATIGVDCNIGAGTITCNYDGYNKHETVLEDRVFIGSDSQLVAPVRVGSDSFVAAGTTVTQDVPANSLALARVPLTLKPGHAEKIRNRARLKKEAALAQHTSNPE